MLLGVFETLELVLAVYSNVAIAWVGAIFADLVVLKPLGISPSFIEFKRAYLYNINPVGCGAMAIASMVSIMAFAGTFGPLVAAYSAGISLSTAFVVVAALAAITAAVFLLTYRLTELNSSVTSVDNGRLLFRIYFSGLRANLHRSVVDRSRA
jgi:hypothetical protein